MPDLLAVLDVFLQEHRRCGDLDGGVEESVGWMTLRSSIGSRTRVWLDEPE